MPVTREMVRTWINNYDITQGQSFEEYLQDCINALQLPDTNVLVQGRSVPLTTVILEDLSSYGDE